MQKTLGALVLLGALIGAFFYVRSRPEPGTVTMHARPVPVVLADKIDKIQVISPGDKKVVLQRKEGETFRIAEPIDYPADSYSVKQILDRIAKLDFGAIVTDKPDRFGEFEVDDAKGAKVTVYGKDGKVLADFIVGKISNGATMIRGAGKNEVFGALGSLKFIFSKDLKNWRDKSILDFKKEDVTRIDAGPVAVSTTDQKAWKVEASPIKIDALDDGVPNGIVSSLTSLKAADFADEKKPAEVGLDPAKQTIVVTLKDGSKKTLLCGNTQGEDTWVKVPERDQVFTLKKYTMERIVVPPIDWRDKTVTSFSDDDVTRVDVVHGADKLTIERAGASFKVTPPVTPLDDVKVKSLLKGLASLKASSFSTDPPAATGLAKPSATIHVALKDKSAVDLRVGGSDATDTWVQRAGRADVFKFKKYAIDRFLKKGDDLKKVPMPQGGPGGMPPGMQFPMGGME